MNPGTPRPGHETLNRAAMVEALAAAAETTTDADLAIAYHEASVIAYRTPWHPDDHPLITALARHAQRTEGP